MRKGFTGSYQVFLSAASGFWQSFVVSDSNRCSSKVLTRAAVIVLSTLYTEFSCFPRGSFLLRCNTRRVVRVSLPSSCGVVCVCSQGPLRSSWSVGFCHLVLGVHVLLFLYCNLL